MGIGYLGHLNLCSWTMVTVCVCVQIDPSQNAV